MSLLKLKSIFASLDNPKVFSIVAFAVILAAIPLTIYLAGTQQEVRQRAQSNSCPVGTKFGTGTYYCNNSCSGDNDVSEEYTCSDSTKKCCFGSNAPTATPTPSVTPAVSVTPASTITTTLTPSITVTPTPAVCTSEKVDVMVVVDIAASTITSQQSRQTAANLAKEVVNTMKTENKGNRVGFIYGNTMNVRSTDGATVGSEFTTSYDSVIAAIENYKTQKLYNGGCLECSIKKANGIIQAAGNNGAGKVVILITEGVANYYFNTINGYTFLMPDFSFVKAREKANDQAVTGKSSGTTIYAFSLGTDTTREFLTGLATGEKYYSASGINIPDIYKDISGLDPKSISGFVFNDVNGNGNFDNGEQKLNNWRVNLNSGNTMVKSATTNASGDFTIDGICDGNYTLTEQVKPGFTQTIPVNPNYYPITITNRVDEGDKIFGNKVIPPTCAPRPSCLDKIPRCTRPVPPGGWCKEPEPTEGTGRTALDMEFKLMAIGTDKSRSENDKPKTEIRDVEIEVFKSTAPSPIATLSAEITYDVVSGTFKGTLDLDEVIEQTGNYAFTARVPGYINKIIGKDTNQIIQFIVKGTKKLAPRTTLIVGDMNEDNVINIEDWNIWSACLNKEITDPVPLDGIDANCDISDLNDDGEVDTNKGGSINMQDYKWLFNSFEIQRGD